MITPEQIRRKAELIYRNRFLAGSLKNEELFPLEIPANKGKSTDPFAKGLEGMRVLMEKEKSTVGYGYTVWLKQIDTRKHGIQSLPDKIFFETASDFLRFIGKRSEFSRFEKDAKLILSAFPILHDWVLARPEHVIRNAGKWEDILKVCRYFVKQPKPNLYVRELPIEVHTKFVEENKHLLSALLDYLLPDIAIDRNETGFEKRFGLKFKEGRVRFRRNDPEAFADFPEAATDISLPVSEFGRLSPTCKLVFIVENEMNYLTFPKVADSIVVWGRGNNVQNLAPVRWLEDKEIWYWGDIDLRGFYILSLLRNSFPHAKSLMMDTETYRRFESFASESCEKKLDSFENLTPEELAVTRMLLDNPEKNRLEQERITQKHVKRVLSILEKTD